MGRSLGLALMLGWTPITVLLLRRFGPRLGVLIAIVGGNLLVPCVVFDLLSESRLQLTQPVAIGLAVALGLVLGDPRGLSFSRIRVDWLDLPMLVYVVYPLSGLITDGPIATWDVADLILQRALGALAPYAAARRYLGDAEGARQIAVAIVVATLLYVPVAVFEAVMGPTYYLGRLYGAVPNSTMTARLGGWRPEGFFLNGLTLATWLALAAVMAFYVWLARLWRPRWGPSWWPALVLVLVSVGCRGVYGYIVLGVGLTAAAITRVFRTRWAIALLLAVAPVYIGLRITGEWNAQALVQMAGWVGRGSTVDFRLHAEDDVIHQVLEKRRLLGFGVELWHAGNIHESIGHWPDGHWLPALWTGGLTGLLLQLTALALVPAGFALAPVRPAAGGGRADSGADAALLALALFVALCLLDSLHNNADFTPQALTAGSLVGMAVTRRRGPVVPRAVHESARPAASRSGLDLATVPFVTSTACLLYVFAHAAVEGYDGVMLVGGLGAALLFAAAGAIGAWAEAVAPLSRLGVFAVLFAALGVSFNLALHPSNRMASSADILQGLALSSFAVACWRRWIGARISTDGVLVALPLLAHLMLRGSKVTFPGSQYLITAEASDMSLFPLFPWLTMAALGARAAGSPAMANGGAAILFAIAAAVAWLADPGPDRFVKFPMNLAYALLSAAAIEAAFALAYGLKRLGPAARGAHWLGRKWLIYFYIHFAIALALRRSGLDDALLVWTLLAAGSIAATWVVARAAAPLAPVFQSPAAWLVPLALIVLARATPGLPSLAVTALAGGAGLIFAAYHDTLAYLVVNYRRTATGSPRAAAGGAGHSLARLAVVLAVLALPEVVGWLIGSEPAPVPVPRTPVAPDRDDRRREHPEPEGGTPFAPGERGQAAKKSRPLPASGGPSVRRDL